MEMSEKLLDVPWKENVDMDNFRNIFIHRKIKRGEGQRRILRIDG
jgi:hypothetical protein